MAFIPDYAPAGGTVTLSNSSDAFTTTGAALQSAGIQAGDDIRINGWVATIATVTGQNAGTLVEPWAQPTQTAQPLRIRYAPDQSRVQASVVALIQRLSNGNVDGLAALDLSAADRLLFTNAANSLGLAPLTAFARSLLDDGNASVALSTLGFSDFFKSLVDDVNGTTLQTSIGGTTVGRGLFTAANAGAAQDALGISAFAKTLLDDADAAAALATLGYEEGTFTPVVSFATPGTSSFSYTVQQGIYRRLGKIAILQVALNFTPAFGTGAGVVSVSLPFTSHPQSRNAFTVYNMTQQFSWAPAHTMVTWVATPNNSTATGYLTGSGVGTGFITAGSLTNGQAHTLNFGGAMIIA